MSWRARLGIIYPADGAIDDEFWGFVPKGVTVHITRFWAPDDQRVEVFEAQADSLDIDHAAGYLMAIPLDAIAYACTSGSFIRGLGGDLEIIERMEKASGVPCTTTSTALVRAAQALQVKRLAVAAPYPAPVTERLSTFLEQNGFEVTSIKLLGLAEGIYLQPVGEAYRLAKEANTPDAEAVIISCTNFRTLELLDAMEQDLGKPVIGAVQATVWDSLRLAGVHPRCEGLGALFRLGRDLGTLG
ncbi:MAG TPA: aspartate/glutamate racemase family protein [Anaerolineae bacterium]|nr:aspartate/glutamate racemase family protein [Anaerolineae bacterium]